MFPSSFWRTYTKDRIFVVLFFAAVASFAAALSIRQPLIERSAIPFQLTALFFGVNFLFALISLRREPLLSYMFLTASILLSGTLYFFYRYLTLIQGG